MREPWGNHALAHAAVVEHFDQHCFRVGAPSRAECDAFDDTHGRLVRRRVFASTEAATLGALSGWPGLRTVLAVESIRSVNSAPTKVESEIRYFLSSCPDSPAVLGQAVRTHWAVENALHWVLDVTFREDDSRVRGRAAARNLALLRKIALNIIGRDRTSKASVRARPVHGSGHVLAGGGPVDRPFRRRDGRNGWSGCLRGWRDRVGGPGRTGREPGVRRSLRHPVGYRRRIDAADAD